MEVKVYLGQKSPVMLAGDKIKVFFTNFFDKIGVSPLEPLCPFCHRRLKDVHCYCNDYEEKLRKFLQGYKQENLYLSTVPGVENISYFSLKVDDLSAKPEIEFSKIVPLFDQGTIARSGREVWFVSIGELKDDVLSFWVRQRGSAEAWHCELKNVSLPLPDIKVTVCHNETVTRPLARNSAKPIFGRYTLEDKKIELDKFSYVDFLSKIEKI